jgi:membrane protease YdiL (CAAX protease family)
MPTRFGRVLRAFAFGILALALTLVGGGIWSALLIGNLATTPSIPWSVPAMALVLWAGWRYLGGSGPPRRTSETRRRGLRAEPVSGPALLWALLAGAHSIVALTGLWIVLFQLAKAPGNALPDFSKYPPVTVALVLGMAALVGAVTEEAGIRGYLQGYLEREFGALVAIVGGSLMMAPGHALTQGFIWSTMLFYLLVDVMFGVTAYLTGSILPGIATHAAGLLTFFALIWPQDAARHLVSDDGATGWFWIHVGQTVAFSALAVLAFRHLASITRRVRPGE